MPLSSTIARLSSVLFMAGTADWLVPPHDLTFHCLESNPVLKLLPMPGDPKQRTWTIIDNDGCGAGIFNQANVTHASRTYGLFDEPVCGWRGPAFVAEWGYEFMKFTRSAQPAAKCIEFEMASYKEAPRSRLDAFERMKKYWNCRIAMTNSTEVVNFIGHYYFNQLAAELNSSLAFFSEVGENTGSVNAHFAFSRGAARTYGKPWGIDMSAWMQGFITDFSKSHFWGDSSRAGGDGGHSMSLFRRVYYTAYMAGASQLIAEAGSVNWFLEELNASSGALALSPLGYIGQEVAAFAREHTVRGITYTPIGIVLQNGHGLGIGWMYSGKAWDVFPLTDGERQATYLLETVWPKSWQVMNDFGTNTSETGYNVASPYGDIFDVLVATNLTMPLVSSYRVLWLAGDVVVEDMFASLLKGFVSKGGVIVLTESQVRASNSSQLTELVGATFAGKVPFVASGFYDIQLHSWTYASATVRGSVAIAELHDAIPLLSLKLSTGKLAPAALLNRCASNGGVVTLLTDATSLHSLDMQDHLLRRISSDVSPWTLSVVRGPRPQMMINRVPRGWNVTLVNNDGVVKQPGQAATVDKDVIITAELSLKPGAGKVQSARALVAGTDVPILANGTLHVQIEAGAVEVVGIISEDPLTVSDTMVI